MINSGVVKRPLTRRRTLPATTPAPILGLNTIDGLADTDPRYGVSIQNFIAAPQGLTVREGTRIWSTGLPGDVTTLFSYNAANGASSKLFAASVSAFYDVTAGGAVGAPVVTGLNSSSPLWQYALQGGSTAGKTYMLCVNGADAPRLYDGTSWTTCTQVATPSAPGQFANNDNNSVAVNISAFTDVTLHARRLWFTSTNSTKAYYTDIDQVSGALYAFDFGPQFTRGGKLWKLSPWSMNSGSTTGIQAALVALSDRGDCVIYGGNNPAVSTSWGLIGIYPLGAPCGRRCLIPFESDLLYLSRDGLYPLSKYIAVDAMDTTAAITTKISNVVGDLIDTFGTLPGFEMINYPGKNVLLLNIPQSQTSANFQFCFNTVTNGWTQFTGWAAATWGLYNNALYYGTTGQVVLSFIGYADGAAITGIGGSNVIATALTAFSDLRMPGVLKHVHQVKPFIVTGVSNPVIRVGVNTDYNLVPITGSATLNPVTGAVWDSAKWDDPSSTWVGTLSTYNQWLTPLCYPGQALAFAISISAAGETKWVNTAWLVEQGGQWG